MVTKLVVLLFLPMLANYMVNGWPQANRANNSHIGRNQTVPPVTVLHNRTSYPSSRQATHPCQKPNSIWSVELPSGTRVATVKCKTTTTSGCWSNIAIYGYGKCDTVHVEQEGVRLSTRCECSPPPTG